MRDIAAKISSDDAMPGCAEFFVKFLFHVCGDILLISRQTQCRGRYLFNGMFFHAVSRYTLSAPIPERLCMW